MQEMGQEPQAGFLVWEDPLKKEMASHFSIFTWNIPQTEEPGGLVHGFTESDTTK